MLLCCGTRVGLQNSRAVVHDGAVTIVTDRDKMNVFRGISKMMVAYITWLLQAERCLILENGLPHVREDCITYIWHDGASKRWGTQKLTDVTNVS